MSGTDGTAEAKDVKAETEKDKGEENPNPAATEDKDTDSAEPSSIAEPSTQSTSDWLKDYFARALGISNKPKPEQVIEEISLEGVVKYIKSEKCQNIITMAGAGISTSAGIPDFRSPGTGLYDNLSKYDLPHPTAVFDISYFMTNPEPFFALAKELWPGSFNPTPCHYFIKLLNDKGLLLRHYTQNIDTLEHVAGLDPEHMVEAHGSFRTSHCLKCSHEYSQDWIKEQIFADKIPKCTEKDCEGTVKPDIVFFGEALPPRFAACVQQDFKKCDLLIIMGTSLAVQPFASLTNQVTETTPRLYINLEKGPSNSDPLTRLMFGGGLAFDDEDNYRDVFWQGTCDDGCYAMADLLGWGDELQALVKKQKPDSVEDRGAAANIPKGCQSEAKKTSSDKTNSKNGKADSKSTKKKTSPTKT